MDRGQATSKEISKNLLKEIADMEENLPTYCGDIDGEPVEMIKSEWNKYNNMKFIYKDSGKPCYETSLKLREEMLSEGIIEPIYVKEKDFIGQEG